MRMISRILTVLCLVIFYQIAVYAQTTGSIAGTVIDSNGAVVPNATVTVKGTAGQEFTATTSNNGTYNIPAVAAGFYTVTFTSTGFKTSVVNNVKVDVGTPAAVDIALEVGAVGETVEITSGGEVLQTQTATVGTNIQGRQIIETPIASRDALDLILKLPGTASVGAPRRSSINGLPKGSIQMTIDGVDVQDNTLRSSDGFFTFVRPRVDAIEEVTVSTANPGAESSGDGAVQVKFVTRRGTNEYRGSLYEQVRNTALNANYYYNKIAGLPRDKIQLNQPGGRIGGPIPFLNVGEGVPIFNSGKDRAFFFVNYEEFILPGSQVRQRTVLTPEAQQGIFRYTSGGVTNQVNLFTIAANNGLPSTIDPDVNNTLKAIQSATSNGGTFQPITNDPNRRFFNFQNRGDSRRKFFAMRLDFNITKNHSAEFVWNRQNFLPSIDFINGQDAPFPDGPSYGQGGVRKSYAYAVRSTLTQNVINEARYAISRGGTEFAQGLTPADFSFSGGRFLDIGGPAGVTNFRAVNNSSFRTTPTSDFTDNITWLKGNHSFNFGGQYKIIRLEVTSFGQTVPVIGFGLSQNETTAFNAFNEANIQAAAGAGASAPSLAQANEARALYAALTARILSVGQTAYLTGDGTYVPNGNQFQILEQRTYGLYAQDSWRLRPNLTLTYGIRWQPQLGVTAETANFARLENYNQLYGVGGPENQFRPGSFSPNGSAPRVVGLEIGEKIYPDDNNNFAPSVGVVWSPNFSGQGILNRILGDSGRSVFRGGYSISYVREGLNVANQVAAGLPGGNLNLNRTLGIGNLALGTLLREGAGNPNLTPPPFPTTPAYPLPLTAANQGFAYRPDTKTGMVHSFSAGYQREIDKNTVVEFRYVGNRGVDLQRLYNINERNIIENGVFSEFAIAQQNLYANIAANRCQTNVTAANCQYNFAYFGPGTGTSPLPIALSYISGAITSSAATGSVVNRATLTPGALGNNGSVTSTGAGIASNYSNALFRSTNIVNALNRLAASPLGYAAQLEGDAGRRVNAVNAGLPSNFMFVNPTLPAGSFEVGNSTKTWYDSAVIEVRRRLSNGLRVQASYVYSRAFSDYFAVSSIVNQSFSLRPDGLDLNRGPQPFDIRHQFKLDSTYDLPIGTGRAFLGNSGKWLNALVGGFSILPTITWQSGSPFQFGNVQLIGITRQELQREIKVRKQPDGLVKYLPEDIINNTQAAFNVSLTSPTGYSSQFGVPTGRFIAPSGYNNCQAPYGGKCGFNNLILYGPSFFKLDVGLTKRIIFTEKLNLELRANLLDALNHPNFRVGGFLVDTAAPGVGGTTFGQLTSGSAYRDNNTTNDPGGRVIDLQIRFNF